jgi:hypothetical protein
VVVVVVEEHSRAAFAVGTGDRSRIDSADGLTSFDLKACSGHITQSASSGLLTTVATEKSLVAADCVGVPVAAFAGG